MDVRQPTRDYAAGHHEATDEMLIRVVGLAKASMTRDELLEAVTVIYDLSPRS